MLVYVMVTEDGQAVAAFDNKEIAEKLKSQVEEKLQKKVITTACLKVNLPVAHVGEDQSNNV